MNNTWERVASMRIARSNCGVALLNGRIHLVSGYCDKNDDRTIVEIYDPPESNSWSEVSSISSIRIFWPGEFHYPFVRGNFVVLKRNIAECNWLSFFKFWVPTFSLPRPMLFYIMRVCSIECCMFPLKASNLELSQNQTLSNLKKQHNFSNSRNGIISNTS